MDAPTARLPDFHRVGRVSAALLAFLVLLVTVQLAFTSVGATTGATWTPPTAVAASDSGVGSLAVSGGANATVAWVTSENGTASVHVTRLDAEHDTLRVGTPTTLASSAAGIDTVAVAGPYVVWDEHDTNAVRLHGPTGTRRVSTAIRVESPTVAVVGGAPVVAWAAFRNGTYDLRVHSPNGSTWVTAAPTGRGSPTLVGGSDGGYLVWREGSNRTALAAPVTRSASGPVVGRTRPLGAAQATGGFGPSAAGAIDAAPVRGGVRAVWTNQRVVTTASLANGTASGTATYGAGQRPRVASNGTGWLTAWLVETRSTGYDVAFHASDAAGGTAVSLPGNSLSPTPVYAPDPAIVWAESTGNGTRVLATSARRAPSRSVVDRLVASPGRFGFVALAAGALGAVTLPLMPWVIVTALLAFLATTRVASGLVLGVVARLAGTTTAALRARFAETDDIAFFAIYSVIEAVAVWLLLPAAAALPFSHPFAVTVLAASGAVAARYALGVRGFWRLVVVFAYLQTALLWTTALPTFL